MTARSKARKRALDVLFESEQRRVNTLETLAGRVASADPPVNDYTVVLVEGVVAQGERIDELLTTYAQGWQLDRMPAVDRAILRIGTYELLWRDDVPDGVVISGLAFGRPAISVEAIAHAIGDVPWQVDNADRALSAARADGDEKGADALLATAPVRAIAQAINAAGIPAHVSWDGGAYVSNATLYGVLRLAKDRGLHLPTTYLHVPGTPEMTTGTATPSLPLELIVKALRIACEVVATHEGPDAPLRRWPSAMAPLPR
jgi:N utilization substance protein B